MSLLDRLCYAAADQDKAVLYLPDDITGEPFEFVEWETTWEPLSNAPGGDA